MQVSTRNKRLLLLLLLVLSLNIYCSKAKQEPYLARVGEHKLTIRDIYGGEGEKPSPSALEDFTSTWINDELIYNDAISMKLDREPDVRRQIEESTRQILINAYIERMIDARIKISDKEIEDYYASHRDEFIRTKDELLVKHILATNEARANEVKEKLKSGADFSTVAREYSEDGYGYTGGELGYLSFDDLPPEVRSVAQKATPGVFYGPIKSNYGYHFILIEDFRAKGTPKELKEVREEINSIIYTAKYDSVYKTVLDSLRSVYNVEFNKNLIDSLAGKTK